MNKTRKDRKQQRSGPQPENGHVRRAGWEDRESSPSGPAQRFALPRWVVACVCLVFAAGATWASLEFLILAKIPSALVGKWVVVAGEQEGATFDFARPGSMIGRVNVQGKEGIVKASVRVEGSTLFSTTRNPNSGQDETRAQTINSLTSKELILEDDRGSILRMERAD